MDDAPLLERMSDLIVSKKAKNPSHAAQQVVSSATGAGTRQSIAKRLVRRYRINRNQLEMEARARPKKAKRTLLKSIEMVVTNYPTMAKIAQRTHQSVQAILDHDPGLKMTMRHAEKIKEMLDRSDNENERD